MKKYEGLLQATLMILALIVLSICIVIAPDSTIKREFVYGKLINVRVDDDAEYHVIYEINGAIKTRSDLSAGYQVVIAPGQTTKVAEVYKLDLTGWGGKRTVAECHAPDYLVVYISSPSVIESFDD